MKSSQMTRRDQILEELLTLRSPQWIMDMVPLGLISIQSRNNEDQADLLEQLLTEVKQIESERKGEIPRCKDVGDIETLIRHGFIEDRTYLNPARFWIPVLKKGKWKYRTVDYIKPEYRIRAESRALVFCKKKFGNVPLIESGIPVADPNDPKSFEWYIENKVIGFDPKNKRYRVRLVENGRVRFEYVRLFLRKPDEAKTQCLELLHQPRQPLATPKEEPERTFDWYLSEGFVTDQSKSARYRVKYLDSGKTKEKTFRYIRNPEAAKQKALEFLESRFVE